VRVRNVYGYNGAFAPLWAGVAPALQSSSWQQSRLDPVVHAEEIIFNIGPQSLLSGRELTLQIQSVIWIDSRNSCQLIAFDRDINGHFKNVSLAVAHRFVKRVFVSHF
jgi:hypothetical protein